MKIVTTFDFQVEKKFKSTVKLKLKLKSLVHVSLY